MSSSEERASFGRRQKDIERERRRRGLARREAVDYGAPETLARFGGGVPLSAGPELLSDELLALLRRHTRPGQKEFGAVINRETGEVLQMVLGGKTSVRLSSAILDSVDDVVAFHTHDDNTLFSGPDWDSFVVRDNADIELLVTEDAVHVLSKLEHFDPFAHWKAGFEDAAEHFRALQAKYFGITTSIEIAIGMSNQEMAKLYGVELKSYPL